MTKTYLLQKILKSCFAKNLCSHLCSLLLLVASCNGTEITSHGSNYRKTVEGLGFTEKRQASSLLKVLYMNEHLSEHLVTEAICTVKTLKKESATIEYIYESEIGVFIEKIIAQHAAMDETFWEQVADEIFPSLTESEIAALIVYLSQYAFGREKNVERYELKSKALNEEQHAAYMEAFQALGLVDERKPKQTKYDSVWIAGASRIGMLGRVCNLVKHVKGDFKFLKALPIVFLVGPRLLWADIDGVNPLYLKQIKWSIENGLAVEKINFKSQPVDEGKILEGKDYMLRLAKRNNVAFDKNNPFIVYNKEDKVPEGFIAGRTYLNYSTPKQLQLTETEMARDLAREYLVRSEIFDEAQIAFVDGATNNGKSRPDTESTIRAAIREVITLADSGKLKLQGDGTYKIILCSNQPFVDRQALVAERVVGEEMKKTGGKILQEVYVEGIGSIVTDPKVEILNSELAALIYEMYLKAVAQGRLELLVPLKELQFFTRNNV